MHRGYISGRTPIPVQLQLLRYVKKISVYSHSATPDQMIRAHNFRFTKLPKSYSSMQFLWMWSFQSVEIPWVSWFSRNDNNEIRSLFWYLSLNLPAGHLNKLLSLPVFTQKHSICPKDTICKWCKNKILSLKTAVKIGKIYINDVDICRCNVCDNGGR